MPSLNTLTLGLTGLFCLGTLQAAVLPYGSILEVRLSHRVSSSVSRLGDKVEATVITPYFDHDDLLVPAGSHVIGTIDHIDRLGLGLRHVAARVDLHFTELLLPEGTAVPIDARVASVEAARESVRTDGAIIGINPTANFSTGVSAVFTLANLAEREFRLPILAFKLLAARSPDAEIGFPAGTEMLLRTTGNSEMHLPTRKQTEVPLLSAGQISSVQNLLAAVPAQQTNRGDNHPSDLVNIMVMGNKDELSQAFRAAGWSTPESHGAMAVYHMFHCAVERKSNSHLPMSNLKLNGNVPDASFEKSLDTFSKRHHIRFWYDEKTNAWLGAATEDIGYKWTHAHITHATDWRIDNERAKVVNDLAFTGCVDKGALIPRASLKPVQDAHSVIHTDGDIAVLQLNGCENPRGMPTDPQKPLPVHAVRIASAVAIDIARSNPVSVTYAIVKSVIDAGRIRENQRIQSARIFTRPSAVANASTVAADGSLAVR